MKPLYSLHGVSSKLEVYEDKLSLTPRGLLGLLDKGIRGTTTIPFASITAMELMKPGVTSGYLRFTVAGTSPRPESLLDVGHDDNAFLFIKDLAKVTEIKGYIENRNEAVRQR
jgi:hypothetical protein